MKIIVIGASGTIGRAVSEELSQRHDVIRVGRTRGDYQVDITSQESVEALFAQTGEVDAIVSTTGNLHFGPLSTMTDSQFNLGLQDKLLGQIRLALVGQHFLRDGGSITLVSGIVAQEPIAQGVNATTVNAGLEGFVRAAACELPRGDPHQSHQPHRAQRVAGGLRRLFPRLPQRSRRRRGAGLSPQH